MRTFSIQTLGCKVNQYESEQLATLLAARGLVQVDPSAGADVRVVNTCSVTTEAAAKSRQTARRAVRLTVLPNGPRHPPTAEPATHATSPVRPSGNGYAAADAQVMRRARVIVTGCWATSNRSDAERLGGIDAVLTHHDDVAARLDALLNQWASEDEGWNEQTSGCRTAVCHQSLELRGNEGWMIANPGEVSPVGANADPNKPPPTEIVKKNPADPAPTGTTRLPLLTARQTGHQRAFLKIQDGCDAHCTYCIIPTLRPVPWSKPIHAVIDEARRLTAAGHVELVLIGIFLGAYGHKTALRRRQTVPTFPTGTVSSADHVGLPPTTPLGDLLNALCTQVPALKRLRLSSLEPGDLTPDLIAIMRSHPQIVPHFHLPLQSGSERVLRRMNRQYTRDDFLRMIDSVHAAFDRPAITTDIIVGFPGETDAEFDQTADVARRAGFIHVHAFPFSPRPGTAAARWSKDFVPGDVASDRISALRAIADARSFAYRQQFVGQMVELLAELPNASDHTDATVPGVHSQHGRTARYFSVHFDHPRPLAGRTVNVRIDAVTPSRTTGTLVSIGST